MLSFLEQSLDIGHDVWHLRLASGCLTHIVRVQISKRQRPLVCQLVEHEAGSQVLAHSTDAAHGSHHDFLRSLRNQTISEARISGRDALILLIRR